MNLAHVAISDATVGQLRFHAAASSKSRGVSIVEEDIPISCWTLLAEDAFARGWDNEDDAIYDNWREIYGVPAR